MSSAQAFAAVTLGDVTSEVTERAGKSADGLPVYGVDRAEGLTRVAKYQAKTLVKYKRIQAGMFAYNPMRLNIGSIGYCSDAFGVGLISPDYVAFRCRPDALSPEFLKYFMRTAMWTRWTQASGVGSVRVRTYYRELARMPLKLPPLIEQQAIACILGALDDKIELNRGRNRTLEAMARAIFQSWFVDFDPVNAKAAGRTPPGLSPALAALFPDSFTDSPLGPIPSGWGIRTLGDLTTKIGSGATPRGGEKVYVEDGIAFVRSQNVYDFEFQWEGLARITPEAASALDGVTLEAEDILFNITGASVLRTCVVDPTVLPARVNQHVARIRAKPDVPPRFLHLALVRDEMKQHLIGFNAGATREAVTKGHLQAVRLVVPPPPILQRFARTTCPLYTQKNTGQQQSRTLATLRDALLPKLISGELRVPDAERIVGRAV